MDKKDFGKIALIVNEFGNMGCMVCIGNISGDLSFKYPGSDITQPIAPYFLSEMLTIKKNEYVEQFPLYQDGKKTEHTQAEMNAKSCINRLTEAQHLLSMLTTFQAEKAKESE